MEKEFVKYLKAITPKNDFLNLFKEIICDIWKQQYKKLNEENTLLEHKIQELNNEKMNLFSMKAKNLLNDDDFKDKSIDYLKDKRGVFVELMNDFNEKIKVFIDANFELAKQKRKSKNKATILAFTIFTFKG